MRQKVLTSEHVRNGSDSPRHSAMQRGRVREGDEDEGLPSGLSNLASRLIFRIMHAYIALLQVTIIVVLFIFVFSRWLDLEPRHLVHENYGGNLYGGWCKIYQEEDGGYTFRCAEGYIDFNIYASNGLSIQTKNGSNN